MSKRHSRACIQWISFAFLFTLPFAANLSCSPFGKRIDKLTLLVSGNSLAYVKNCGCATGQTGGVLRQMRVARQERDRANEEIRSKAVRGAVLLLETGNFSDPGTGVKRIESEMVVTALSELKYDAVGLGSKELTWPQADLLQLLSKAELALICANLEFTTPKPSISSDHSSELNALIKPFKVVTSPGGYRIGVIHAIQSGVASELGDMYGYRLARPAEAVAAVLEKHRGEADCWILTLADGDHMGSTPGGLEKLDHLMLLIGLPGNNPATGADGAAARPVFVAAPYQKAKDLLRIQQFFDQGGKPAAAVPESLALRADVKFDEQLATTWDGMQVKLQQLAVDEANALRLARATATPPFHVGQQACIECHKEVVDKLMSSKHNRAFVTLVDKQVDNNASCVKCHVVGYGAPYGWNVVENQPNLQGVQCENCHGPASLHLDLYKTGKKPAGLSDEGRDEFGLLPAGESACVTCHDVDNSPEFNFDAYWAQIEH